MNVIHKLPFILAASSAIVVGIISYRIGIDYGAIYLRMSISMVVFFITGIYIKDFLNKIEAEVKEKIALEEKMKEEGVNEDDKTNNSKGKNIDFKVDDQNEQDEKSNNEDFYDEEFTPLKVGSVKVKEDTLKK